MLELDLLAKFATVYNAVNGLHSHLYIMQSGVLYYNTVLNSFRK